MQQTGDGFNGGAGTLLQFKAGKLNAKPKGNKKFDVEADPRKGLLVLSRNADGTTSLHWKVRATNSIEDDILVFPENQTFAKVETGRANDRVYLLQFKASSRRFFFWMQDPKAETDAENCRKLNEYMTNPQQARPTGSGALSDTDQNALMQFLSNFGGGAGTGENRGRPLQGGDLSSVLQGMNLPNTQQQSSSNEGKWLTV
mmetsp:Transcript_9052/g.16978  ORF Transcript_9052/g.16978 Transcript_9052/m.16978 type:complete len:201 (-) Transcript_9052:1912-2514(-)